jgi:hypothetical protein
MTRTCAVVHNYNPNLFLAPHHWGRHERSDDGNHSPAHETESSGDADD